MQSRTSLIVLAALAGLALAGCNNNGRTAGGSASGVCKPFTAPTANTQAAPPAATALPGANVLPAAPPEDPSAALDDCLHRWGYTLAGATDAANVVAEATLAACSAQLAGWNQQSLSSAAGGASNAAGEEAPSLLNGQSTNPLAEHFNFAQGRALFYVVQARAGHCGPPPASSNGAAPANRQ